MVSSLSTFRPSESVFEIGKKGKTNVEALLMQKRRAQLSKAIGKNKALKLDTVATELENQHKAMLQTDPDTEMNFDGFNDISKCILIYILLTFCSRL
jgi:hypothetical protein